MMCNGMARYITLVTCGKQSQDIETEAMNENIWISINVTLKFVPKLRINNISAFG